MKQKATNVARWLRSVKDNLARGVFPHELSFFLDWPWRRVVLPRRELVRRLALAPAGRVLEVGAGSGYYSAAVARAVGEGRLELLDVQPEMLKKARLRLEAEGVKNVGYTLADAGRLPFAGGCFDVVFLVAVLGEVAGRESFLGEARRVLKPRGVLSVSEHLPDPDFSKFARVRELIEREGFECFRRDGAWWSYTASFRPRR